jgi:hypothetical protein
VKPIQLQYTLCIYVKQYNMQIKVVLYVESILGNSQFRKHFLWRIQELPPCNFRQLTMTTRNLTSETCWNLSETVIIMVVTKYSPIILSTPILMQFIIYYFNSWKPGSPCYIQQILAGWEQLRAWRHTSLTKMKKKTNEDHETKRISIFFNFCGKPCS